MRYLVIVLVLLTFQSQSQYTVIHTIGKIYDTKAGKYLEKGSKVDEEAKLRFDSNGARAAVLSSSRGRFVIQKNQSSVSQSDAVYALTTVISPVRGRLSTRSGSINNVMDFQKHFNEGTVALVGKSYQVSVSPSAFPLSESRFFYAQYLYGDETINKKLGGDEDNLIINLNEFFSVDGNPIEAASVSDVKLFYYDAGKGTSKFITDMDITYVSDETLKSLVNEFPEDPNEPVLELINSMFGKCTEEQISQAISALNDGR